MSALGRGILIALLVVGCNSTPPPAPSGSAAASASASPAPSASQSASASPTTAASAPAPASPSAAPDSSAAAATPAAPAGFTIAVQELDTVVRLSWGPSNGASGYLVYRDQSATPLVPTPTSDTSFEDIGLTNGRAYSYVVAALDASGAELARTPAVSATPKSH